MTSPKLGSNNVLANLKAKLVADLKVKESLIFEQAVLNLVDVVIELSPVGKPEMWAHPPAKDYAEGHYVANWQFAQDKSQVSEIDDIDPEKRYTREKLRRQVRQLIIDDKLYGFTLANGAPYAERIENGHHRNGDQWARHNSPPGAIMALSMQRWDDCVRRAKEYVERSL